MEHPDGGAVWVDYSGDFLLKVGGRIYAIEMKGLHGTEEPEAQGPGSAVSYKVRQLDEKGVYQEIASGTTDEWQEGGVWVVTPDFKLEWSYGSTKGGWLYVGALPKGAEYYSEQVRSPGERGVKLDPAKWTVVKKAAPPADPASEQAYSDPKTAYRTFLEAMRRCDLDAALKCFAYGEKEAEAMKVIMGIFIAHRRFEKAVEAKFGLDEKTRALFEGWLRPDITDAAIDASTKRLARATVNVDGDSATAELRWDEAESGGDYLDLPVKKLRKMDGVWKLDGRMQGDDFFEKGGWGRLFRNSMEMMNEISDKVAAGEFRSVDELKTHIDARQKVIEQEYENELPESAWDRMGEKKE